MPMNPWIKKGLAPKPKPQDSGLGTCVVPGCKKSAGVTYPLLPGSPGFCEDHHRSHGEQYSVDFSSPDDFDIPE